MHASMQRTAAGNSSKQQQEAEPAAAEVAATKTVATELPPLSFVLLCSATNYKKTPSMKT